MGCFASSQKQQAKRRQSWLPTDYMLPPLEVPPRSRTAAQHSHQVLQVERLTPASARTSQPLDSGRPGPAGGPSAKPDLFEKTARIA